MDGFLLFGKGILHPSIYLAAFVLMSSLVITRRKNSPSRAIIIGIVLTGLLYLVPVLLTLVALLFVGMFLMGPDKPKGEVVYDYDFLTGKGRYTFCTGSTYSGLNSGSNLIPDRLSKGVGIAMHRKPFQDDGSILVRTHVEVRSDGAVISDYVVTNEQLMRYRRDGVWEEPADYVSNSGVAVRLDEGLVHKTNLMPIRLKKPGKLESQFMAQFNGPKLQKRERVVR